MPHSRLLVSVVLLVACSSPDDDDFPIDAVDAAPAPTTATLSGTITRSIAPVNGGRGPLFVAVFDKSPLSGEAGAPVAQALVPDVDLSGDGVVADYLVTGIPPRDAAYHVVAFLDDNQTVDATDPSQAGPDKGDLLSMDGIMAPTVVLAGDATLDLDLNFAMPF